MLGGKLAPKNVGTEIQVGHFMSPASVAVQGLYHRRCGTSTPRILIADDHEIVRHGIRALIENHPGWEICGEAIDGREAVEKARELRPDLALLDAGKGGRLLTFTLDHDLGWDDGLVCGGTMDVAVQIIDSPDAAAPFAIARTDLAARRTATVVVQVPDDVLGNLFHRLRADRHAQLPGQMIS